MSEWFSTAIWVAGHMNFGTKRVTYSSATTSGWPAYRLQNIYGPFWYWFELIFLPPAQRGLREHSYKVFQGACHRRRRESSFSMRVLKYWNKLGASVVTAPSVSFSNKRLEKVWTEVFPHLPHLLKTHLPIALLSPPPIQPAHHLLTINQLPALYVWFLQAQCGLLLP